MSKNRSKKTPFIFLLLAVLSLLFFLTFLIQKPQTALLGKPNIVLINIDSLRADHIGGYGYDKNTTPFLDSLIKKGIIFENAITPAYLTFQTDAAIFSGLYPSQNNVMTWETAVKKDLTLLPKILNLHGYRTAAFVSPSLWPYFGFNKQFQKYEMTNTLKTVFVSKDKVLQWANDTKEPYFIFWHIYDVHSPYLPAEKEFLKKKYEGVFSRNDIRFNWERQSKTEISYKLKSQRENKYPFKVTISKEDVEYNQAAYDSGIKYVDEQLKLFFSEMQKREDYKNTLFIISSEHGDDLKEHGFLFHRDLYDVNIRVPLIFYHPKLSSRRIKDVVSTIDILPTILGLTKITKQERAEGVDLTAQIFGQKNSEERMVFTERPPFDEYSVRTNRFKYILRNPDKFKSPGRLVRPENFMYRVLINDDTLKDEFYDLEADPYEKNNLAGKEFPEVEKKLKSEAEKFRERMRKSRQENLNLPIRPQKTFVYP